MELEYMEMINEFPKLMNRTNVGVSLEEIESFELENELIFPKAYREFLLLSGEKSNVLLWVDHSFSSSLERQANGAKRLKEEDRNIGENYWIICDMDGGGQFHFFYLNDPDADDLENPPVYASHPDYASDEDPRLPIKKKLADSFQGYIEEKISSYSKM